MKKNLVVLLINFISYSAFAQVAQQRQDSTNTQGQRQDISITAGVRQKLPVARAAAYAPNIISKCSGSAAAGAQAPIFGFSFAGSYKDDFCERVELIKLAISMGHEDVADDLFYQFPMIIDLERENDNIDKMCDYPTKCTRLGR